MSEAEYAQLCRLMSSEAGIQATFNRRRGYEQVYFTHHKAQGVRLRKKYRPV